MIRRIVIVLESNDPTARALAFLTLGELRYIIKDISYVHHLLLNALESRYQIELNASIHAIGKTSISIKEYPEHAYALLNRINEMVERGNHVPLDTKLQLVNLLKYTGRYHSDSAYKAYIFCSSLLKTYPSEKFIKVLLTVMTTLTKFNLFDLFIPCSETLVGFIIHDIRLEVKALALSQLSLLMKSPGAMEGYHDQLQWFQSLSEYFKEILHIDSRQINSKGVESIVPVNRLSFGIIANKILDVFLVISRYSPALIKTCFQGTQSVFNLCFSLVSDSQNTYLEDRSTEIICNVIVYSLNEKLATGPKEGIFEGIDKLNRMVYHISFMLLRKNQDNGLRSERSLLKCLLTIYKEYDMLTIESIAMEQSTREKILENKYKIVNTLLSKIYQGLSGHISYDDSVEAARHLCTYYGVYHIGPKSLPLLMSKVIHEIEARIQNLRNSPNDDIEIGRAHV